MNTLICYLYRDADNYKVHNRAVVTGGITPEQEAAIMACRIDDCYFKPQMVGLPESRFEKYDPEVDHDWFELYECAFQKTTAEPTVDLSVEQLVKNFEACRDIWAKQCGV